LRRLNPCESWRAGLQSQPQSLSVPRERSWSSRQPWKEILFRVQWSSNTQESGGISRQRVWVFFAIHQDQAGAYRLRASNSFGVTDGVSDDSSFDLNSGTGGAHDTGTDARVQGQAGHRTGNRHGCWRAVDTLPLVLWMAKKTDSLSADPPDLSVELPLQLGNRIPSTAAVNSRSFRGTLRLCGLRPEDRHASSHMG